MGPFRAHGPSAGPAEAKGFPEAHGSPKVHGPRGHCTPLPPSRWPWLRLLTMLFPGSDLKCAGRLALSEVLQHFLAK